MEQYNPCETYVRNGMGVEFIPTRCTCSQVWGITSRLISRIAIDCEQKAKAVNDAEPERHDNMQPYTSRSSLTI